MEASFHRGLVMNPSPGDTVIETQHEALSHSEQEPAAESSAQALEDFPAFSRVWQVSNSGKAGSLVGLAWAGMLWTLHSGLEPISNDDGAALWMSRKARV